MTEEETLQLKRMLVTHYSAELETEISKTVKEKGYISIEEFKEIMATK